MKTGLPDPTTFERARWDDFRHVGCVCCWMLGYPETPYDVHHLLSGGIRRGHIATIPVCPAHHRGVGFSPSIHFASIARNPRTFRETFGGDDELLTLTDRLIAIRKRQTSWVPLPEAEKSL